MPKTIFQDGTVLEPEFLNLLNSPVFKENPEKDGEIPFPTASPALFANPPYPEDPIGEYDQDLTLLGKKSGAPINVSIRGLLKSFGGLQRQDLVAGAGGPPHDINSYLNKPTIFVVSKYDGTYATNELSIECTSRGSEISTGAPFVFAVAQGVTSIRIDGCGIIADLYAGGFLVAVLKSDGFLETLLYHPNYMGGGTSPISVEDVLSALVSNPITSAMISPRSVNLGHLVMPVMAGYKDSETISENTVLYPSTGRLYNLFSVSPNILDISIGGAILPSASFFMFGLGNARVTYTNFLGATVTETLSIGEFFVFMRMGDGLLRQKILA